MMFRLPKLDFGRLILLNILMMLVCVRGQINAGYV
jgi:hypothetical protein